MKDKLYLCAVERVVHLKRVAAHHDVTQCGFERKSRA
jgi:hypothetical protein